MDSFAIFFNSICMKCLMLRLKSIYLWWTAKKSRSLWVKIKENLREKRTGRIFWWMVGCLRELSTEPVCSSKTTPYYPPPPHPLPLPHTKPNNDILEFFLRIVFALVSQPFVQSSCTLFGPNVRWPMFTCKPEFSQLTPLCQLTPAISSCPMEWNHRALSTVSTKADD
jgi:hypothetical protein